MPPTRSFPPQPIFVAGTRTCGSIPSDIEPFFQVLGESGERYDNLAWAKHHAVEQRTSLMCDRPFTLSLLVGFGYGRNIHTLLAPQQQDFTVALS
jgi:hypothetical protein